MPAVVPKSRWEQTGRSDVDIAFPLGKNVILAWSHEEVITPIVKDILQGYKDFLRYLFQIRTKFRNEPRAKSGLLHGREFFMKDAYSFHVTHEDFEEYYQTYFRVYKRCGLQVY